MYDAPISAARPGPEGRSERALETGWERLQERAKQAQISGDLDRAARYWRLAHLLGIVLLVRKDPRWACTLANAAAAADHHGHKRLAEYRRSRALTLWERIPDWIKEMRLTPRARSSLFHLRLEQKTGAGENLKKIFSQHVRQAKARIAKGDLEPPGGECRWLIERPVTNDDSRRLAAACFLLAYAAPRKNASLEGVKAENPQSPPPH